MKKFKFIILILTFVAQGVCADVTRSCPVGKTLSKIEFVTDLNLSFGDLIYGLPIVEGKPCDDKSVLESVNALRRRNIFETINYTFEEREEGLTLVFELIPFLVLSEVEFFGNSVISASELLRGSGLKIGNNIFSEDIREAEKRIKKIYIDAGFSESKVEPSLIAGGTTPLVSLEIRIIEGDRDVISEIVFDSEDEDRFPEIVDSVRSGYVDKPLVKNVLGEIKKTTYQNFAEIGYYQASVDVEMIDNPSGKLSIDLKPRSKFELEIEGNNHFTSEYLISKLDLSNRTVPLRVGALNNWCDDIKQDYISKGFLEVIVKCEIRGEAPNDISKVKKFYVNVEEGSQYEFRGINYLGNQSFNKSRLQKEVMPGRFSLSPKIIWQELPVISELLAHVSQAVKSYYVSEGYLDAEVEVKEIRNEVEKTLGIDVEIKEGQQAEIREIVVPDVDRDKNPGLAKVFDNFRNRFLAQKYKVAEVSAAILEIEKFLNQNGFADSNIYPEYKPEGGALILNYQIPEQVNVRRILIAGNYYTTNSIILREITFKEGDYFSSEKIEDSKRALLSLGIFKSIDVFAISDELPANQRDVQVVVKERETGIVDGLMELSTQDGLHIRGQVGQRNLFGEGKALVLSVDGYFKQEIGNYDAARARLAYASPKLFGSKLDYKAEGFFQTNLNLNRNFKYDRLGVENSLRFPFLEKFGFTGSHIVYSERLFDVVPEIILSSRDTGTTLYSALKTTIDYDQRDDPFTPTKGYRVEIGGSLFPEALGSQVAMSEGHTQVTTLLPISNFWTYALNLRGGMTRVTGDLDNVPLGSRYFIGGRDTLRGYTRYQVSARSTNGIAAGGDTTVSLNNEFRYQLTDSVLGLLFLDVGQAFLIQDKDFQGDSKADLNSLRYSPGIGAQYLTPIGPLGLEVGFATNREFGERWGRMLVSIGSAF